MHPATATTGHITRLPPLPNTYTSDPSLRRVLGWYLAPGYLRTLDTHLTTLGAEAISPQIKEWSADAERNQPYVKGYNVWGEQYGADRLVTSEGWKKLTAWGARNGVVALGYEDTYGDQRRVAQYAVNYIYAPSSGMASCPISMTDGAALILSQEIARQNLPPDHAFQVTLRHLLSRGEDFWTSGQWMTERAGGSDVANTETWASYSPLHADERGGKLRAGKGGDTAVEEGEYMIRGFKFFSSATDANVALLLAKTEPAGKLSTFLAPLRINTTTSSTEQAQSSTPEVTNGIRIHRLKTKLGTKELPTAELILHDTRAHLVGDIDKGVATIAPLLNITRTHTFIGSLGAWRRALSIAKNFARARTTVGEPLWLIPMHLRVMAELEGRHLAAMEIAFLTVGVMGVFENGSKPLKEDGEGKLRVEHLPHPGPEATTVFRTLTALSKAVVSKMSIAGIQECQEALGGVGYMDEPDEPEFNISRILRNTLVNSIWEGTTNVLASEFVRFLVKGKNLDIFGGWMERVIGLVAPGEIRDALVDAWRAWRGRVDVSRSGSESGSDLEGKVRVENVLADGRRAMFTLAWILCGSLLVLDAQRDGDGVTGEIAQRWVLQGEIGVGDSVWRDIVFPRKHTVADEQSIRWDCRIAWGEELPAVAVGHRSMKL
ncbi:hypothetical protein BJX63DRAFT_273538 [Aspergillus granulosus]|uniref:Acyl-CoA dehydrogenase n=1 Tax=Aspergillus granulosus TaxID=176169 RepID=A0ABR4H8E8_9EURO